MKCQVKGCENELTKDTRHIKCKEHRRVKCPRCEKIFLPVGGSVSLYCSKCRNTYGFKNLNQELFR